MSTPTTLFSVAVTGHRPEKLGGYRPNPTRDHVHALLTTVLTSLHAHIPTLHAISGMALGVDQLYAHICTRLQIPFSAYLPFDGQERRWPVSSQQDYRALLQLASAVQYTDARPNHTLSSDDVRHALFQRNADMVANCQAAIAVWNGSPGGTAHAVRLMRHRRIPLLVLHPEQPLDDVTCSAFVADCRSRNRSTP